MPSARVWSLASVAGVVVFVWSMLAAGISYDERQARIESVTKELTRAPDDIPAWNDLASLIVNADETDKALARWLRRAPRALLEKHAGRAMLLYRMGSRLRGDAESDAYAGAIELLEAFTREHPELAQPHHWHTLALGYRETDQPDKALAACERTEATSATLVRDKPSPNLAVPLYWLGAVRHELGDPEGGRRGWALLVRLMDQTGELRELGRQYGWDRMSEVALRVGDTETAVECLTRYEARLERASGIRDMPERWRELGMRWRQADREADAQRTWRRLASIHEAQSDANPDNPSAAYNLACYRALAGDASGAMDAWREAVARGWTSLGHADRDADLDAIRDEPEFARLMVELADRALATGDASEDTSALLYLKARYQTVAGDRAGAVASLGAALDRGFLDFPRLRDDPLLAPLEDQPGYHELRQRMRAKHEDWRERRRQGRERAADEAGAPA